MSDPKVETRAVLAGAYRGGRASLKTTLSHTVEVDDAGRARRVLCNDVALDSIADRHAADPDAKPTCPRCVKKDPRRREETSRS